MRSGRALLAAGLLSGSVAGLVACGGNGGSGFAATEVKVLRVASMPDQVLDLATKREKLPIQVGKTKRPFVDAVTIYSLRKDDLLQATLQISRFTPKANATSSRFRRSIVNNPAIGSTTPTDFRIAGQTVWLTSGKRQTIAIWFKDRYMFVMDTREEYEHPRELLRQLLAVNP